MLTEVYAKYININIIFCSGGTSGLMTNKNVGIALLLFGIILALMPGDMDLYAWLLGAFLGFIGLILHIGSGKNDKDDSKNNKDS